MPDPFDRLLGMVSAGGGAAMGPRLCEGEVLDAGLAPLRVFGDGYALEADDLKVNPLYRWAWSPAEDQGQVELLRKGERVLLASLDRQTYYLICKVVDL